MIGKPVLWLVLVLVPAGSAVGPRQMEFLNRGTVAIDLGDGRVYVGWRLLAADSVGIGFNLYRDRQRLNTEPLTNTTLFVDAEGRPNARYSVRSVIQGREGPASVAVPVWPQNYLTIPLQTPEGYRPNDASVGDLDGDGDYEIVLHQAGRGADNSRSGRTDAPILEAYTLEGIRLWRINLGHNIREGAHYTQFMVYDLDGDGCAEVACKTGDGTVDGQGRVIGDAHADYRNERGTILAGPEFLTVFDGVTGAALATTNYLPPRHPATVTPTADELKGLWGDGYGNRVDRFLACIAYLDGKRPSLVMCRGYYTRTVLTAWNWRQGRLSLQWTFDSGDGPYGGQGNHGLSVADIDNDGRDEIVYGACAIDDDGTGLYNTGLGHGDALHLSDIDPGRPGLEVWGIHEKPRHAQGANLRDAATGNVIWGLPLSDPGRGLSMDIDPRHVGYECWASSSDGLYNCKGARISELKPRSCNMGVWWDGDLLRELLDGSPAHGGQGGNAFIDKWNPRSGTTTRLLRGDDFACVTNNGTKANPCLCADILGDWREEVIWRTRDGQALRLFTTTIPTDVRLPTLMHDPVYRLSVAWQNVAYNQPTQPGYYLGQGMARPPRPNIWIAEPTPRAEVSRQEDEP